MTLPYERTNAVNTTRIFLMDLTDPKATPRIPRAIRQKALWCLRHYPTDFDMQVVSESEDKYNPSGYRTFGTDPWSKPKEEK